ncbi:RidA family protein [uncultured Kiloniella sp.]|uniref:RidA family protein n=1 Tax=Kiloniella sp. TaxID=1938587 RepID=UPI00262591B4|nr:RidA family protein [uncultured Kiloniella sp.]
MSEIIRHDTTARSSKIVEHGNTVYLSGQVGTAGDSVTEQTKEILKKIDTCLESVGSDKTKILQAVIWLSDMKYFAELNEVWNAWVPEGYAPARACGEAKLARAELSVEIIITAAK